MPTSTTLRAIWSRVGELAKAAGLPREDAEDALCIICREISGQTSTRKLSARQAEAVCTRLREQTQRAKASRAPDPEGTVTRGQLATVEHLFDDLATFPQSKNRRGFAETVIKKPWPQTVAEGRKMIEALSAMFLRKIDAAGMVEGLLRPGFVRAGFKPAPTTTGPWTGGCPQAGRGVARERTPALTDWERGFLLDVKRKLAGGRKLKPGAAAKLVEIWRKKGGRSAVDD